MQKRTNPLALKTDTPSRPLTRRVSPFDEPQKPVEEEIVRPTPDVAPVPQPEPLPVPQPEPEVKAEPTFEPETVDELVQSADATPAAETNPYGWHFVAPRAPEPVEPSVDVAADEPAEQALADEQDAAVIEEQPPVSTPTDEAPVAPAQEQTQDEPQTEEPDPVSYGVEDEASEEEATHADACVADEHIALGLEDYALAARFSLCGRIGRKMKTVKVSSDVGRLAQLMHPDESLSTIVENALLTRIYLENRDAFDALAEMIEKKGGHIKC